MKTATTFLLGALTGAALLWFGFSKTIIPLSNNNLVAVNRFTGQGKQVFVSSLDAALAENRQSNQLQIESEKMEQRMRERPDEWREMTEEEMKKLEFAWGMNGGGIALQCYNPLPTDVRLERVRVRLPATADHPVIDREYSADIVVYSLRDGFGNLNGMNIDAHEFFEKRDGGKESPIPGAIVPTRILIHK